MTRSQPARSFGALCLAGSVLTGCSAVSEAVDDFFGDDPGPLFADTAELAPPPERDDVPRTDADELPVVDAPPTPSGPVTLSRAQIPLTLPGRGATDMGFRIDKLAELFALAGTVTVPPWSVASDADIASVRDDDLDTAWTCVPEGEQRCSLAIEFPKSADVHAIRLYAAASVFTRFPRVKRVRVHTEAGFTDVLLSDREQALFIQLGESVRTRYVALEVLEVYLGSERSAQLHIAELEVYGHSGQPRAPLQLQPNTTLVELGSKPWVKRGRNTWAHKHAFLYRVDNEGGMHRLFRGSAVRGREGDRLMLIERIVAQTACTDPRGTFFLLDTQSRMLAPLGDMGGVGGQVWRAKDGNGIAVGYRGTINAELNGVFVEGNRYRRKQTPLRADQRTQDYFEAWALDPDPVARTGAALNSTVAGCVPASEETLAALLSVRAGAKKRSKRPPATRPEAWQVCSLADGARAFVSDYGPCGPQWELDVLNSEGDLVASRTGKAAKSFLRVVPHGEDAYLVQVGDGSDITSVVRLDAGGIVELAKQAAFALQPPAACREDCLAPFPNPHAPVWK